MGPTVSINPVETTNSPCLSTSHIVTHRSAVTITLDLVKYLPRLHSPAGPALHTAHAHYCFTLFSGAVADQFATSLIIYATR